MPKKSKVEKQKMDYLDPEATNPDLKTAKGKLAKLASKILKLVGNLIKKALQALLKLLFAFPVGTIIAIVIILIIIVLAYEAMPGAMKDKLKEFFAGMFEGWFVNGAVEQLDEKYADIIGVANYLEDMGYDLIRIWIC